MSEINARVARFRKAVGLRQSDMAALLGLKVSTYSQMERQGKISCELLVKICEILKISPLEILYEISSQEIPQNYKAPYRDVPYEENPLARMVRELLNATPIPTNKEVIPVEEMGLVSPDEIRLINLYRQCKNKTQMEILRFAHQCVNE